MIWFAAVAVAGQLFAAPGFVVALLGGAALRVVA